MTRDSATRRRVLRATGVAVAAGTAAGCMGGNGDGGNDNGNGNGSDGGGEADFGGWMDGVSNYDGVVDATGDSEVTVAVGAGPQGLQFDPPAIRVAVGTTVAWEWTGDGGAHNVIDQGGAFESDLYNDAGVNFEYEFESAGTYKYYCSPHRASGMKAVAVVE